MSVQVSRFTAQFCKNTERFDLKAIQLKMSGIDGSFILYNNVFFFTVFAHETGFLT